MMDQVLIIGKPNSGKSLLFNRLTGLQHRVANFPGVTVQVKTGKSGDTLFTDFPGIYSFHPITEDEKVAVSQFDRKIKEKDVRVVLCLLDVTRLEKSLILGLQAQKKCYEVGKPIVFALNMIDELGKDRQTIPVKEMEAFLGSPVVPVSARTQLGLLELKQKVLEVSTQPQTFFEKMRSLEEEGDLVSLAKKLNQKFGPKVDVILRKQNALDRFFLSSVFGGLAFAVIMVFLFQSIFTWASPAMDLVEEMISAGGSLAAQILPPGVIADFVEQAIFGGFGSFLVFVPQIFVLTFIIGLLEDSGYLARAAVICHRPLSFFGMSGKSFVPLLSGHACAIPAIFAARTIESPKKRLLTVFTVPLMACSARLPVYSLLIAALIPSTTYLGGLLGLQGLTFFALYAFGLITALVISSVLSQTIYRKKSDSPFIIELPPYRVPHWKPLLRKSFYSSWTFITKAGLVIFLTTVVVWVLGYFPNGSGHLNTSYLASLGKWIDPLFKPIGLGWEYAVAILASFLAREVFVGTLGTLFGIEGADENIAGLSEHIQNSGLGIASGIALLVFYAIALQCVSTLAVMRKETGSFKIPVIAFVLYGAMAYLLACIAYFLVS